MLAFVMVLFPPVPNPTLAVMNWSIVIYAFVISISLIYYYFKGRYDYEGPVEYINKECEVDARI